ncbi:TetR/AcrR family transcriptional regulator [Propionibacteriaceae bacterium Y2011]
MTRSQTGGSSSGYGRADKRQAIASAARRVFGRDGYTRTSIDTVATEAQVSRRTIYNHFGDKHNLFLAVALEGAVDVTEAINSLMERHLRKVIDLREDLIDFSLDRVAAVSTYPDHFALVRTIEAEAVHLPSDILQAWISAGPQTAYLRLAPYLASLAARGLLEVPDPELAANHLTLLTVTDVNHRTFYGAVPLPEDEVRTIVTTGVDAFLSLYRGSRADP